MEVYLIDIETQEIKCTYSNIIAWDANFVEFMEHDSRTKTYCDIETEYFSDKEPVDENFETEYSSDTNSDSGSEDAENSKSRQQ